MTDQEAVGHVCRFLPASPRPRWMLDVGVGLGREAHEFKALYPDLNVLGFEPAVHPCVQMREEYPGALLQCGVGLAPGVDTLYQSTVWQEWGTMFLPTGPAAGTSPWRPSQVPVMCLNELDKLVDDAVLWVDVEGSELEVLKGADRLLRSGRILLINAEVRPAPLFPGSCTEAQVAALLGGHGYRQVSKYNSHGGDDPHWDVVFVREGRGQ